MSQVLDTKIMFLKGVGEKRAVLLRDHMGLDTFRDLLMYFPYRHEDRSVFLTVSDVNPGSNYVQLKGKFRNIQVVGGGRAKRLSAELTDHTGVIECVWFNGISWLQKTIKEGALYIVYGKLNVFNGKMNISHPEVELETLEQQTGGKLQPMYSIPEKLKNRGINNKLMVKLTSALIGKLTSRDLPEILPQKVLSAYRLPNRAEALFSIHHPASDQALQSAKRRIKFEELFLDQVRMLQTKKVRYTVSRGLILKNIEGVFTEFYKKGMPFELTDAQKRVLRELRNDVLSGHQMNRLLQGDVGSGKTIVALMGLLMAVDNGHQGCLMAPTETNSAF